MLKITIFLITLFAFCFSSEYTVVHWNTVSFPPSLITDGQLKNQGYSDVIRNILMEKMPEYKHTVEFGNVKFAMTNARRLDYACFSGLNINKKRKEFIRFSQPTIYSLPNELTIKKSNVKKFKKYLTSNNKIDLMQMLKDDKFILGYVEDRAYNSYIDELLQKYKSNKAMFRRSGADLTKGLLQMLAANRVDYILEYPTMVKYNKNKHKIEEEFIQYPIKNASGLIQVYVGCSKSKYGKELIKKINIIISDEKQSFSNAYKNWIPIDSVERYEKAVKMKTRE